MERGTILVVDDEPNIADLVELYLRRDGYRVVKAATGEEVAPRSPTTDPDSSCSTSGSPASTASRCAGGSARPRRSPSSSSPPETPRSTVSSGSSSAPTITSPSRSPRPSSSRASRPCCAAPKARPPPPRSCRSAVVTIDVGRREVRIDDTPVAFTGKEFDLLKFLAERPGLALSRQQILDGVWGFDWFGDARTVDVHIAQVRKKLDDAVRIDTVRGVGYRLDPK